jgi:hypothetical protein
MQCQGSGRPEPRDLPEEQVGDEGLQHRDTLPSVAFSVQLAGQLGAITTLE